MVYSLFKLGSMQYKKLFLMNNKFKRLKKKTNNEEPKSPFKHWYAACYDCPPAVDLGICKSGRLHNHD